MKEFLDKTLPAEASDGQSIDQRTAFYAGFYFCLTYMTGTIPSLPDDDAETALVLVEAEVFEYFEKLEHGYDWNALTGIQTVPS